MNKVELRKNILLILQSSLLGCIWANVRSVSCRWSELNLTVRFVIDGDILDEDIESIDLFETELYSHLPDWNVEIIRERLDFPLPICFATEEILVFRRRDE